MKLITKAIEKRFAEIGSQEKEIDPIVVVKFFNPVGSATWFATEYNKEDNFCYGYVKELIGAEWNDEWGDFSIDEMEAVKIHPYGLGIERDIHFKEQRFSTALGREYLERNFKDMARKLKKIVEEKISKAGTDRKELRVEEEYKDRMEEMKHLRNDQGGLDSNLER